MFRQLSLLALAVPLAGCLNVTVVSQESASTESKTGDSRAITGGAIKSVIPAHQSESPWYTAERDAVLARDDRRKAKNIVLFLGDGMGISTVTAARIYAGQQQGKPGEEHVLSFEQFPITGLSKTYNVNSQTPDSAGTMSAVVTGVKTNISMFGVDEIAQLDDCAGSRDRELVSLLEIAELAGRSTGVVSTARLTHATPAATFAKTPNRDWESDMHMPEDAVAEGCLDVATQFVTHRQRLEEAFGAGASDGIEVALGGGRRQFFPEGAGGERKDGTDLVARWQAFFPQGSYVENARELKRARSAPLLGLFDDSHMDYAMQRAEPGATQPSLTAMTLKALELLQRDNDGYLLVVEAGRIDHAHHAGNAANALHDTVELADAVAAVAAEVSSEDTLVLVTADHSHVFTMAGYPRRGNPILGKVIPAWSDEPMLDADGKPYTTLGYMNGRGFRDYGDETNADVTYAEPPVVGRQDISDIDTTAPGYHQEALVPSNAETHGGEDVAVYASGPGSGNASGSYEQNRIFHILLNATDWERDAAQRVGALQRQVNSTESSE